MLAREDICAAKNLTHMAFATPCVLVSAELHFLCAAHKIHIWTDPTLHVPKSKNGHLSISAMTIFNFLPSTLFSSASAQKSGSDPIAEIFADFGLGATADAIFSDFTDSSIGGLLSDPFDLSISSSFGVVNDSFYLVSGNSLSGADQNLLDDDLASYDDCPETRKLRAPNSYSYSDGNVSEANWNKKFLCGKVRARTYYLSERDRFGDFRCLFRVPLKKVDDLVSIFLENDWIPHGRASETDETFKLKAELLIMSALNMIGHNSPFRSLPSSTEINKERHRKFFHHFLSKMYSIRDNYIYLPRTPEDLDDVMEPYCAMNLPGACGSVDVVHIKWSNCPAGDYNRCKGKEGYPTLAFEAVTDNKRRIMGISSVQFGTRNDKHIVKLDAAVAKIRDGWYNTVTWNFYDSDGQAKTAVGVYLICDGGYLRWPILVCPYQSAHLASLEGYFSSNLESVRKDVECVFGILKKRSKMLEYGIRFRNIRTVEKVFIVCCILHNMMLSEMEMESHDSTARVGRGAPLGMDSIWLQGALPPPAALEGSPAVREAKKTGQGVVQAQERVGRALGILKAF